MVKGSGSGAFPARQLGWEVEAQESDMRELLHEERPVSRRIPVGAEVQRRGGVHFRVWAPRRRKVEVAFENLPGETRLPPAPLTREESGYFSGLVPSAVAGMNYGYRLDDGLTLFADPASRFQPNGPHGLSRIVDPATYPWQDSAWEGVALPGQVIYEMHVGTFTPKGTWAAATGDLHYLAELGVTLLEVMPIADFVGRFGWGYDGVNLFAPTHLYGSPDDARRFVDRAQQLGLGVHMDVG